MQRKFRQFIGSLLLLTFLFGTVSVSAADVKNIPEPNTQRANWVKIGELYENRNIQNIGSQTATSIAISLANGYAGLVYTLVLGIAGLYKETATSTNITAYYKREMYRSQDNPMYWRDIMAYYYDSGHTLQVGSPVQSNVYEMIDKQAHDVIEQLEK